MARKPIDDLIDKPLNELTEEEAQIVIEWQAAKKFEAYRHENTNAAIVEQINSINDAFKVAADENKDALLDMQQRALAFYDEQ